MARKKKPFKKFLVIASVLVALELVLILMYSSGEQPDFVAAMNSQIAEDKRIPPEKRTAVKLQLALNDYRVKNNRWPNKLDDLVPVYFERTPIDPETGTVFKYTVEGNRYFLGERADKNSKTKSGASSKASESQAEQLALVASLDQESGEDAFIYDPQGKRDPFRSHDFSAKPREDHTGQPLENYTYDDLTLTAVLKGLDTPKAIVEIPSGRGYTVTLGEPIGSSGGKIVEIKADKLVILETTIEFTGEKRTRTIEMYLR
ncbi:MAG: pilus assembly protein PilP [Deltaproteobacteria bacterium]|nr:pilus assembly protein PilP [Deltaproteobacteria bacterium]